MTQTLYISSGFFFFCMVTHQSNLGDHVHGTNSNTGIADRAYHIKTKFTNTEHTNVVHPAYKIIQATKIRSCHSIYNPIWSRTDHHTCSALHTYMHEYHAIQIKHIKHSTPYNAHYQYETKICTAKACCP